MLFRMRETGELVDETQLRFLVGSVSLPAVIDIKTARIHGADLVVPTPLPTADVFQVVTTEVVQADGGAWKQKHTVVDITDPVERAAIQKRIEDGIETTYKGYIQEMLDKKARENGYDDIKSASIRAGYPGPYHEEGVMYASWMDECWKKSFQIRDEIKAGVRQLPNKADFLAMLPKLSVPSHIK